MMLKQRIIQLLPPPLFIFLKKYGWSGDFRTWEEAKQHTVGYDAENIVQQVKSSLLKVKNGEAVYERDSVLFDKIEYSWELLSALMWIAAQDEGKLNIIDFGGSLGSTYFQNKKFLDTLKHVSWNVVEQPDFVRVGKESFQNEILKFHTSISDYYSHENAEVILFSSVLQYLENPYEILKQTFDFGIKYVLVDRTCFTLTNKERITIQKVSSRIYDATYPCRFFSESDFISFFEQNNYMLIADFNALDQVNIPSIYKGFIFQRKENA